MWGMDPDFDIIELTGGGTQRHAVSEVYLVIPSGYSFGASVAMVAPAARAAPEPTATTQSEP